MVIWTFTYRLFVQIHMSYYNDNGLNRYEYVDNIVEAPLFD